VVTISTHEIVRLNENDAAEIHELLKTVWSDTYRGLFPERVILDAERSWHSTETLQRQMKSATVLFAGYREGGRILGMIRAAMADAETLRIFQLYVLPSEQGKGIGRELMGYARESHPTAKRLVLNVAKGNDRAISFYAKYGFAFRKESSLKLGDYEIQELEGTLEL
jgi:diamine N-acetyltransferase